ncbi:MAG: hypothetical protein GY941_29785 [Planctomycetes bacterium]|nr:hypothetical protein [Planctomycetota bacterium]
MAESFHPEGIGYAFHADSSVCLVKDGVLVAVAEEERFRRIKHWAGFSSEAIRYCLQAAGIGIDKVEHVSVNQDSQCSFNAAFLLRLRLQSAILRIGQFEELLR